MKRPDTMTSQAEYLLNPPSKGEEEREGQGESNLDLMELIEEREELALRRQELRLREK